jgi:hypothetical protein
MPIFVTSYKQIIEHLDEMTLKEIAEMPVDYFQCQNGHTFAVYFKLGTIVSKNEICNHISDRNSIKTKFLKEIFTKIFNKPILSLTNKMLASDIAKLVSTSTAKTHWRTGWIFCPTVASFLPVSFHQTVNILNTYIQKYVDLYSETVEYKTKLICEQYLISDISWILIDYITEDVHIKT